MHIVCPHCTTSYAIDLATLGAAGRTVRCSRCKEVWRARPEDATEIVAPVPAMAAAGNQHAAAEWDALTRQDSGQEHETPVVDSPSISADWPDENSPGPADADRPSMTRHDAQDAGTSRLRHLSRLQKLLGPLAHL